MIARAPALQALQVHCHYRTCTTALLLRRHRADGLRAHVAGRDIQLVQRLRQESSQVFLRAGHDFQVRIHLILKLLLQLRGQLLHELLFEEAQQEGVDNLTCKDTE